MKNSHSKIVTEMAQFAATDSLRAETLQEPMIAALEWLVIFGYIDPQKIESWPTEGLVIEAPVPLSGAV